MEREDRLAGYTPVAASPAPAAGWAHDPLEAAAACIKPARAGSAGAVSVDALPAHVPAHVA